MKSMITTDLFLDLLLILVAAWGAGSLFTLHRTPPADIRLLPPRSQGFPFDTPGTMRAMDAE
jgi:hypothetical protein